MGTRIDFGLAYNFRNPEAFKQDPAEFYEDMFQQIVYAEELGFDSVWLPGAPFLARRRLQPVAAHRGRGNRRPHQAHQDRGPGSCCCH